MKELAAAILQFLEFQARVLQQQNALMEEIKKLLAAERETEAIRGDDGRVVGARQRLKMMQ